MFPGDKQMENWTTSILGEYSAKTNMENLIILDASFIRKIKIVETK
jgi:hypothetical protein